MLDGNVLLRQKRDEVPEGTLSCPDRNLAVFHHYRHYEGLRLLPSVYDSKLIQQTLFTVLLFSCLVVCKKSQVRQRDFSLFTLHFSLILTNYCFVFCHFFAKFAKIIIFKSDDYEENYPHFVASN